MHSLSELFSLVNNNDKLKDGRENALFSFDEDAPLQTRKYNQADIGFVTSYFSKGFKASLMNGIMRELFDLSFNVFDIILHAWLSELPVEMEIIVYAEKALDTAKTCNCVKENRGAAEKIASNRLDADSLKVINASEKVYREVHRMMGLLRFNPDDKGGFSAKCEPDHFILPCLGEYFISRFGEIPWTIMDVKRNLSLCRRKGEKAKIERATAFLNVKTDNDIVSVTAGDEWEDLWKHYHKTINNEDRENPNLQCQFMPQRYWKYLPEK